MNKNKIRGLKWNIKKLRRVNFVFYLFFCLNTIIMISHSLDLAFVLLYFFFYFFLFWRYCPIIISSQQQFIIFFFFILKVKGRNLIDDKDTITNPDHYNNIRTSREAATILQTRQLCKIIIIIIIIIIIDVLLKRKS